MSVRMNPEALGRAVDWRYLAQDAPLSDVSSFLDLHDSYSRTEAMFWTMLERSLRIFLESANDCDAPWAYRSHLADLLRPAIAEVGLTAHLRGVP